MPLTSMCDCPHTNGAKSEHRLARQRKKSRISSLAEPGEEGGGDRSESQDALSAAVELGVDTSRFLTRRYVVALSLIGLVLLGSHLYLTHQLSSSRGDAERINRSGMQRMLSQQIALRAERILHAEDPQAARTERAHLREHITLMADNAAFLNAPLLDGAYSEAVAFAYEDAGGLAQANDFLARANRIANGTASHAEIRAFADSAAQTLESSNAAVLAHQGAAETRLSTFVRIEQGLLALGLLVLLLEALFIFRPMVSLVGKTVRSLAETNTELEALAYQMPHDLRAPIASAQGLLSAVEDELEDAEVAGASSLLRMAQESMLRLDHIVSRIVEVVRVLGTGNRPPPAWVELDEVFEQAAAKVAHLRDDVDVRIKSTQLRAWVSPSYLEQAVDNLVSNAIKYADVSGGCAFVELDTVEQPTEFLLRVRDNGIGIPKTQRAKLFGMFKRFHPNVASGNGLGLYLARQSARALGGDIFYSACEPGSLFELHVPKAAPDTRPTEHAAAQLGSLS